MSDPMTRESIEAFIARAREFKMDSPEALIAFYRDLPLALRLAMFFCPGGPVDPEPPSSPWRLEALQVHTFLRMPWQARGDLVRRAERFLAATFKNDPAKLEPLPQAEPPSELAPLPDGMMLPVENTETADVLRLFRAFVIRGATQWQIGCNHHHPIWALVAEHVSGDDPTSGPEYEFIYPTNRQRLSVLKKLAEEKSIDE